MDKDFSKLWHYLTHEQVSALDVLILSIVGSFFTWILAMVGRFLGRLLLKTVISVYKYLLNVILKSWKEFHRRYISKKVTMNEYIIIKDKLDKGERLKGYEQKKYERWEEEVNRLRASGRLDVLTQIKERDDSFKG